MSRGLVVLCVLPPFDAPDEYQHVAYIEHLGLHHAPPRLNTTSVSPEVVAAVVRFPQSEAALVQLRRCGAMSYAEYWRARGIRADNVPPTATETPILYEAQHTPFYYRLALPLYRLAGGLHALPGSLSVLRAANLLVAAGALLAVLLFLPTFVRSRVDASFIALAIATQPLFLVDACRVANDALAVLGATLVVLASLRMEVRRTVAHPLALGLLVGLAILAKALNVVLLPYAALAILVTGWQTGKWRTLVVSVPVMIAGAAVVAGPYFYENLRDSGRLLPLIQHAAIGARADSVPTTLDAAKSIDWVDWLRRLWGRGTLWVCGWSSAQAHPWLKQVHVAFVGAGLLGCALPWIWRRRWAANPLVNGRAIALSLILCGCFTAGLAQQAVLNVRAYGSAETAPWYLSAGLPWFLCSLCAGFVFLTGRRVGRGLMMALVALFFVAETEGLFVELTRKITSEPRTWEALAKIASLQPPGLRTPTLSIGTGLWLASMVVAVWAISVMTRRESDASTRVPQ